MNNEWLRRMEENRRGMDPEREIGTADSNPYLERASSSYSSPPSRAKSQYVDTHQLDWLENSLQERLTPSMRDRIRDALRQALIAGESELEPMMLSPSTRDKLGEAYQIARDESVHHLRVPGGSQRVLYDLIYSERNSQEDSSLVEFAEFRGWLDRIFDESPKRPVERAVDDEMVERVRSAWSVKDTRLGAQTASKLKEALRQAERDGQDGKRFLFELVDADPELGGLTEFGIWCNDIFGEYPSPPRYSPPPADRNPGRQWRELESPVFIKVPKSETPNSQPEPAPDSPWGKPWRPTEETTESFGPSSASLVSIATAGELAVEEMDRQGHFDYALPRKERWHAPDSYA